MDQTGHSTSDLLQSTPRSAAEFESAGAQQSWPKRKTSSAASGRGPALFSVSTCSSAEAASVGKTTTTDATTTNDGTSMPTTLNAEDVSVCWGNSSLAQQCWPALYFFLQNTRPRPDLYRTPGVSALDPPDLGHTVASFLAAGGAVAKQLEGSQS